MFLLYSLYSTQLFSPFSQDKSGWHKVPFVVMHPIFYNLVTCFTLWPTLMSHQSVPGQESHSRREETYFYFKWFVLMSTTLSLCVSDVVCVSPVSFLTVSMRRAWADDNQKCHKMFKNFKFLEFGDYIWNHHQKRIQISTNMPNIGWVCH